MSQTSVQTLVRPELTLPAEEARALREAYADARVILEYGSGGSTVVAADMPGKRVFSVESDADWAQMMHQWFAAHPPAEGTEVDVLWSNIGKTKEWGHPVNHSEWRRYPRYAMGVWQQKGFEQPDVVLVDGRFRVGCALASAYLTEKPITILFDDFAPRESYHKVQEYLGPARMIGRMARFDVEPAPIPKSAWLKLTQFMYRP
ncbi:hypothetical protein [Primorskyibacter sp. S187A]|uniref:hypothetical protein n=1 Tax=Primorskyibacter sp. S187A TaxID=3415130 RepID=UPI003C7B369F